ncbi:MAG: 3-dehydroquinate synthase II [Desulfovibrio sp.]|nr:3-dehydroquinate synthase II [Desulfovibrio sp.]
MAKLYYQSDPFSKEDITLALESGVDGIIVAAEYVDRVAALARVDVFSLESFSPILLQSKADEEEAQKNLAHNIPTIIKEGWEVIPIENLLAQSDRVMVEVGNLDEAKLAGGILERGVYAMVLLPKTIHAIKTIVAECALAQKSEELVPATITKVAQVGLGHRVCVDTLTLMHRGQGMLVGNSSAFLFLVHAETEENAYVAARPFRINAGAVHAYVRMPGDKTRYLSELKAGSEILLCDATGKTMRSSVGRVKIEVRPMLLIEAEIATENGCKQGGIVVQNAETIRLTAPDGTPVSVVSLKEGDQILCRIDQAGRHFGMRISENIVEV